MYDVEGAAEVAEFAPGVVRSSVRKPSLCRAEMSIGRMLRCSSLPSRAATRNREDQSQSDAFMQG